MQTLIFDVVLGVTSNTRHQSANKSHCDVAECPSVRSPTLSLKKINNWHRSTTGTQEITHEHNQASSQQLPIARKSLRIDDLCDSGKTRRKARYSSRRGGVGGSDVSLLPRCHVAGIKALLVHYEADAIMKSFHPLTFAIYLATLRVGGGDGRRQGVTPTTQ